MADIKKLFRLNTVFYKLVASNLILILVSISALGFGSYWYFSANFNQQVERVNARMLYHLRDMIDKNVLLETEQLYVDLIMGPARNLDVTAMFDQDLAGNHSRLYSIHLYLNQLSTGYGDLVESIDIYYPQAGAKVSSSAGGITLSGPELHPEWMKEIKENSGGKNALWYKEGAADADGNGPALERLVFVRAYPIAAVGDHAGGYIAIRLKPEAVNRYLQPDGAEDRSVFLLFDKSGQLMVHSKGDPGLPPEPTAGMYRLVQETAGEIGHFRDGDGSEWMVSYTTLPDSGWRLVNLTPMDQYYEKSYAIRNTLMLLCAVVVAMGMVISNLFTLRIYNPIKTMVRSIRNSFSGLAIPPAKGENELKLIDHVINHLSLKVNELERTFEENMPLVKHHLITGLMERTVTGQEELQELLRLLGMSWAGSYYCCVLIEPDPAEMSKLSTENAQFIPYSLIRQIESNSGGGMSFLATALPQYRIGIILAAESAERKGTLQILHQLHGYLLDHYMIPSAIAYGEWVINPLDLYVSAREAEAAFAYRYFMPETVLLNGAELMERERQDVPMDEGELKVFSRVLRTGDVEQVARFLKDWTRAFQAGGYRAEAGHQRLRELAGEVRAYIRELNLPSNEILQAAPLLEQFKQVRNVHQMAGWLEACVQAVYRFLADKQKAKGNTVMMEVMDYIKQHYHQDISLDTAAEYVSLSPRYLSKVFKEETGHNFTDYVTRVRLERAVELILHSEETVEQIGKLSGFNSAGYFIKKFKEQYGVTPGIYKSLHGSAPES